MMKMPTHTHTHARTYTHIHALAHAHTHAHAHTYTNENTHKRIHTRTYTHSHTRTHTYILMHTHTLLKRTRTCGTPTQDMHTPTHVRHTHARHAHNQPRMAPRRGARRLVVAGAHGGAGLPLLQGSNAHGPGGAGMGLVCACVWGGGYRQAETHIPHILKGHGSAEGAEATDAPSRPPDGDAHTCTHIHNTQHTHTTYTYTTTTTTTTPLPPNAITQAHMCARTYTHRPLGLHQPCGGVAAGARAPCRRHGVLRHRHV